MLMVVHDIILQEGEADYEHGLTGEQVVSRASAFWAMQGPIRWFWLYLNNVSSECPSLLVACVKPHGYFLSLFEIDNGSTVNLVAQGATESTLVIPMEIGEWELEVLSAYFVGQEQTADSIRHFCKTGLRSPSTAWVPYEDMQTDFYR
jgi:hypothetical protein